MEWLQANWEWVLVFVYVAEKVVKASPSDKDDILFDVVWNAIKKIAKKEGKNA